LAISNGSITFRPVPLEFFPTGGTGLFSTGGQGLNMELNITEENAKKFVRSLWDKIMDTGFNALAKNDFYDYTLYLFNKYNKPHFLDENSNYDNAMLLKVTETKIKTSKLNITLKYKAKEEKADILKNFFRQIAEMKIHDKQDYFEFVLEDPSVKMAFEHELKQLLKTTLEYSINNERVKIEKSDFFQFLMQYTQKDESYFIKQLSSKLKNEETIKQLKNGSLTFIETVVSIAKDITSSVIAEIVKTAIV
jgi:hypothetical protein